MPGLVTTVFKKGFNAKKATTQLRTRVPIMINDAIGIIKADVTDGLIRGIDISGNKFPKLKPATVKAKIRKGSEYPNRALWDTGIMQNTYLRQRAKINNPVAILRIAQKRIEPAEIGKFHQLGMGNNPLREWFGFSDRASDKIEKMLRLNVHRVLDDEFHLR